MKKDTVPPPLDRPQADGEEDVQRRPGHGPGVASGHRDVPVACAGRRRGKRWMSGAKRARRNVGKTWENQKITGCKSMTYLMMT